MGGRGVGGTKVGMVGREVAGSGVGGVVMAGREEVREAGGGA